MKKLENEQLEQIGERPITHPSPFENEAMLNRVVERLGALADPVRLKILNHLRHKGPSNVGALVQVAGISQPSVSRHLAILKRAGLVDSRPEANQMIYAIRDESIFAVCGLLCEGVVTQLMYEETLIREAVGKSPSGKRDDESATGT